MSRVIKAAMLREQTSTVVHLCNNFYASTSGKVIGIDDCCSLSSSLGDVTLNLFNFLLIYIFKRLPRYFTFNANNVYMLIDTCVFSLILLLLIWIFHFFEKTFLDFSFIMQFCLFEFNFSGFLEEVDHLFELWWLVFSVELLHCFKVV